MAPTSASNRPAILVSIQQDFILRDLLDSGTLRHLNQKFRLQFVISGNVEPSALKKLGEVLGRHRVNRLRLWPWNCLSALRSIQYWRPVIGEMEQSYYDRKKPGNYRGTLRLLRNLSRFGLGKAIAWILHLYLSRTVQFSMPACSTLPSLVLVPSIMRDLVADDMFYWARRNGVPSLALQANLDTFNVKVSTTRPDFWAVWGDQSWYMARLVQHFSAETLFLVGSPRFEAYRDIRISRAQARLALGLPDDATVILFLGGSAYFDETKALGQIEHAIESGHFPKNTVILYKPHPKGPAKGSTEPFDINRFQRVILYKSPKEQRWSPLEEYPVLFTSGDAVVTPFSTIGFEAARHGLPIVGVGYHIGKPQFWEDAVTIHTKAFFDRQWCLACCSEEEFLRALEKLPHLIANPEISSAARHDVRNTVFEDDRSYGERIGTAIEKILSIEHIAYHDILTAKAAE